MELNPLYAELLELAKSAGSVVLDTLMKQVMLEAKMNLVISSVFLLVLIAFSWWLISQCYKGDEEEIVPIVVVVGVLISFIVSTFILDAVKMLNNPMYYAMQMFAEMVQ